MKKLFYAIITLILACAILWGCAPKNDTPDGTEPVGLRSEERHTGRHRAA